MIRSPILPVLVLALLTASAWPDADIASSRHGDTGLLLQGTLLPDYASTMGVPFEISVMPDETGIAAGDQPTSAVKVYYDPGVKSPRYGGIKFDLAAWGRTDLTRWSKLVFEHRNDNTQVGPFRVILHGPMEPGGRKRRVHEFTNSETWIRTEIDLSQTSQDWRAIAPLSRIEYLTFQLYWDPATHPGALYLRNVRFE